MDDRINRNIAIGTTVFVGALAIAGTAFAVTANQQPSEEDVAACWAAYDEQADAFERFGDAWDSFGQTTRTSVEREFNLLADEFEEMFHAQACEVVAPSIDNASLSLAMAAGASADVARMYGVNNSGAEEELERVETHSGKAELLLQDASAEMAETTDALSD